MKLLKLPENSGGAAIPRNLAMKLSRGRYVTFVDSDDLLLPNALQTLVEAAVNTNADVVHCEGFLTPTAVHGSAFELKIETYQAEPYVDKITLETDNLAERVIRFCNRGYIWNVWSKLYRRDFLVENRIEFINARTVEDMIFVFNCVCYAPRYVRVPELLYVYRVHGESITHSKLAIEKQIKRYVSSLARGAAALDQLLSRHQFFNIYPQFKVMVFDFFAELHMLGESAVYLRYPPHVIEPLIRAEFAAESTDGAAAVMSFLLHIAHTLRRRLLQTDERTPTEG